MKMGMEIKMKMMMLTMVFLLVQEERADARSLTRRTSRRRLGQLAQPHAPHQSRRTSSRRLGQLAPLRPCPGGM